MLQEETADVSYAFQQESSVQVLAKHHPACLPSQNSTLHSNAAGFNCSLYNVFAKEDGELN